MSAIEFFLAFFIFVSAVFFGACLDNVFRRLTAVEKLLQARSEKQEDKVAVIEPTKASKASAPPKVRRSARK